MRPSQRPAAETTETPLNDGFTTTARFEYPAGSLAGQTGIYIFEHACSRPPQTVVAARGQRLPGCPECMDGGRYLLKQAVPHLSEDPDLRT